MASRGSGTRSDSATEPRFGQPRFAGMSPRWRGPRTVAPRPRAVVPRSAVAWPPAGAAHGRAAAFGAVLAAMRGRAAGGPGPEAAPPRRRRRCIASGRLIASHAHSLLHLMLRGEEPGAAHCVEMRCIACSRGGAGEASHRDSLLHRIALLRRIGTPCCIASGLLIAPHRLIASHRDSLLHRIGTPYCIASPYCVASGLLVASHRDSLSHRIGTPRRAAPRRRWPANESGRADPRARRGRREARAVRRAPAHK